MYQMSNVVYRLADGTVVKTLREAKNSNQKYTVEYVPIYEVFTVEENRKHLLRSLE